MPAKKATKATKAKATTATTKAKPATTAKAKAPAAPKKAPAAKVTKKAPAKKPAPKTKTATATAPAKSSTATSKKRKADESDTPATTSAAKKRKASEPVDPGESAASTKPAANQAKKRKSADEPTAPAAARPIKKARSTPKVVINTAPTTKLHVYVCGEGSAGELGLGSAKNVIDVKRPRLNPNLAADTVGVVQLAVGGMHVAALTHDNKILTWGVNDQGALGRDTTWDGGMKDADDDESVESDSGLNPKESTPIAIPSDAFPEGTVFVQLAAGDSTTFALTDDGKVYGWGTFRVSLTFPSHPKLTLTSHLRVTKAFLASLQTLTSNEPRCT